MEAINNFLNFELFSIGNYHLLIKQAIAASFVVIISFILIIFISKILWKIKFVKKLNKKNTSSIIRFLRLLLLIFSVILFFKVLGFDTEHFLNYKILKTENISFTLSDIIELLIILFATKFILYIIELIFEDNVKTKKIDQGKGQSLFQIITYFIWIIAIALYLESVGFSITFLIASLSALLVGLGLGIQHFFTDIISGIIILFDHSIKVGDIVELQDGSVGKVEQINLRNSKIISRDDVVVLIPNSKFTSDNVINWSHNSFNTRFGVTVDVAYGSDVQKVKQLLIEAAIEHPEIKNYPKPIVFFRNFGSSSLDFEIMFMTEESFRVERIKSDLRFTIYQKFNDNNITIPFPQTDVHIKP
jgi:small-conductance mechanosensitive channel